MPKNAVITSARIASAALTSPCLLCRVLRGSISLYLCLPIKNVISAMARPMAAEPKTANHPR